MARRGSVADAAALRRFSALDADPDAPVVVEEKKKRSFMNDMICGIGCYKSTLATLHKDVLVIRSNDKETRMEEAHVSIEGCLAGLKAQGYTRRDLTLTKWKSSMESFTEALTAAPSVIMNACEKAPKAYYEWLRNMRRRGCLVIQVAGNAVRTKKDQIEETKDEASFVRQTNNNDKSFTNNNDGSGTPGSQPNTPMTAARMARQKSLTAAQAQLMASMMDINQSAGGAHFHVENARKLPTFDSMPDKLVAPYSTGLADYAPVRDDGCVEIFVYVSATRAHAAECATLHNRVLPRLAERLAQRHVRLVVVEPTDTHQGLTDATLLKAAADCAPHFMIILCDTALKGEPAGLKALKLEAYEPVLGTLVPDPALEWVEGIDEALARQEYETMQATGVHTDVAAVKYLDGDHRGAAHVLAYRRDPTALENCPPQFDELFYGRDKNASRLRCSALWSTLYACPYAQIRTYRPRFGGTVRRKGRPQPFLHHLDGFARMVEQDLYARIKRELFSGGQLDSHIHWHRSDDIIQWRMRHSLTVCMNRPEIEKVLFRAVKLGRPAIIAITALPGMGATQALTRAAREARRTYGTELGIVAVWANASAVTLNAVGVLRLVCRQILWECQPYLDEYVLSSNADGLAQDMVTLLSSGTRLAGKRLVVIIDGIDAIEDTDKPWLPKEFDVPEGAQIMFSVTERAKVRNKNMIGNVATAAKMAGGLASLISGGNNNNIASQSKKSLSGFRLAAAKTILKSNVQKEKAARQDDPTTFQHFCYGGELARQTRVRRQKLTEFLPRFYPGVMANPLKLKAMGVNDRKNLLLKLARSVYKEPTEGLMDAILSIPAAQGPFFLQLMHALLLRDGMYDQAMLAAASMAQTGRKARHSAQARAFQAKLNNLPQTISELIVRLLESVEAEMGSHLVHCTLSALVCAGGSGLSFDNLYRIALAIANPPQEGDDAPLRENQYHQQGKETTNNAIDKKQKPTNKLPPMSSPVWDELLAKLRPLVARTAGTAGLYSFAHHEIVEAVSVRYITDTDIDVVATSCFSDILMETLENEVLVGAPSSQLQTVSACVTSEISAVGTFDTALILAPIMLIRAKQIGRAVGLVTSTRFIEAKFRFGMFHDLRGDLESLLAISAEPGVVSDVEGAGMTNVDVTGIRHLLLLMHTRGWALAASPHLLLQEMLNTTLDMCLHRAGYFNLVSGVHEEAAIQYRRLGAQQLRLEGRASSDEEAESQVVVEGEVLLQRLNVRHEAEVCLHCMTGHTDRVLCVAFSPDGRTLATGSADKSVRLWESHSSKELHRLEGHAHHVRSMAWSPDGQRLACGVADGSIALWNVPLRDRILLIDAHEDHVRAVCFNPADGFLASSSNDTTVTIWEVPTGTSLVSQMGDQDVQNEQQKRALMTLEGHVGPVTGVVYCAGGTRIVTCSMDGTVRVWNPITRSPFHVIRDFANWVTCLATSGDDASVYAGSLDGTIRMYNVVTGRCTKRIVVPGSMPVKCISCGPGGMEGEQLAVGVQGEAHTCPAVLIWRAGAWVARFDGHTGDICDVSLASRSPLVASGSDDGTVRIWGCTTQLSSEVVGSAFLPQQMEVAEDDTEIGCIEDIVQEEAKDTASVTSGTSRGSEIPTTSHAAAHSGCVDKLVFCGGERAMLVSAGVDGVCKVWHGDRDGMGTLRSIFDGHSGAVRSLCAVAPHKNDEGYVFSGGSDGTILQWSAMHGAERMMLIGHEYPVSTLACDTQASILTSGDTRGNLLLWWLEGAAATSGEPIRCDSAHTDRMTCMNHADERVNNYLASGAVDGTIKIWDVSASDSNGAEMVSQLSSHARAVRCCAWGDIANSPVLATGSSDGTVWLFDIRSGIAPVASVGYGNHGWGDPVNGISFLGNGVSGQGGDDGGASAGAGTYLVTAAGRRCSLYDLRKGGKRAGMYNTSEECRDVTVGPDGMIGASAGRDVIILRASGGMIGELDPWNLDE